MNWKQRLLDWNTPEIEEFSVLDLLVARKSVLLVAWKGKHISSVRFPQLRKRYNGLSRGVVLSFPESYDSVVIEFKNGFHKRVELCALRRIQLSVEEAGKIIESFGASVGFRVIPFKPTVVLSSFRTAFDNLHLKIPEVFPVNNKVYFKSSAFEYTGKK